MALHWAHDVTATCRPLADACDRAPNGAGSTLDATPVQPNAGVVELMVAPVLGPRASQDLPRTAEQASLSERPTVMTIAAKATTSAITTAAGTKATTVAPVVTTTVDVKCWGRSLQRLAGQEESVCDTSFFPRSSHMKNKFCNRCLEGQPVPITHIRALTPEIEPLFSKNATTTGFWTWGTDFQGGLLRYRLINQTMRCKAPRLAIFAEPDPPLPPGQEWGLIPSEWISAQGMVSIVFANGTLSPVIQKYQRRRTTEASIGLATAKVLSGNQLRREMPAAAADAGPSVPVPPYLPSQCGDAAADSHTSKALKTDGLRMPSTSPYLATPPMQREVLPMDQQVVQHAGLVDGQNGYIFYYSPESVMDTLPGQARLASCAPCAPWVARVQGSTRSSPLGVGVAHMGAAVPVQLCAQWVSTSQATSSSSLGRRAAETEAAIPAPSSNGLPTRRLGCLLAMDRLARGPTP